MGALVALLTFICTFGSALLAARVGGRLPRPHASNESQGVVRLGMGLVATMTALLLGVVIGTARSSFDGHDGAVKASAVSILVLDRHLAQYGPETAPIRELLRQTLAYRVETTWPSARASAPTSGGNEPRPAVEEIQVRILRLSADTEEQRWFRTEALRLSENVMKTRWRLLEAPSAIPPPFLAVVIAWLTFTFASFGLYAPRNATVFGVLFVVALSVSAAVLLIMELDSPFDGLIKVSAEPLRFALDHLGQ